MGYDVHITRKNDWLDDDGEEISISEWKNYISSDPEMRLDGYAEAITPNGTLRVESEGMAVWLNWSKHEKDGGMAWMDHSGGNVISTNPDDEVLKKMFEISLILNAKVQGEECEVYDADGQSNWKELKEEGLRLRKLMDKKWWQLWK